MNDTKETERAELHKTIWRIANDLRGSVDDFKGVFDELDVNSNKLGPSVARRKEKLVKPTDIDAIVADLEGEQA